MNLGLTNQPNASGTQSGADVIRTEGGYRGAETLPLARPAHPFGGHPVVTLNKLLTAKKKSLRKSG
jgi:hypothetical protein